MAKIIGITGGIGSGKTTVVNYIQKKGYPTFIADEAGKLVMQKPEIVNQVNSLFNHEVLLADDTLNRRKIAQLVFSDENLLRSLNNIIHPAVAIEFENFKILNSDHNLIFKEAAILFESGAYKACDATILITAPLELRIKRVMNRDKVSKEDVLKRMRNQLSDEEKLKLATYTVTNIELNQTFKRIDEIIEALLKN